MVGFKQLETLNKCLIDWNVNYSVYPYNGYTINEVLMQFFDAINKGIITINEYTNLVSAVMEWVKKEGLKKEVTEALDKMVTDGVFNDIINHGLFEELNSKINNLKNNIDYVLVESFGVHGNDIVNDTINFKKALEYATNNNKVLKCLPGKTITINGVITIKEPFKIDFNNSTICNLHGDAGINVITDSSSANDTQSYIKNLMIDCTYNKIGLNINAKRCYLSNINFFNIVDVGLCFSGGYEITTKDCNFRGITPTNKAIVVNTTDIYIHHCFGTDNNVFIENNRDGNVFESCHAWILTPSFLKDSIFINLVVSAEVDKCISDTYYIAFKVNSQGSSRINGNNVIINTEFYNSKTYNKPPIFIFFTNGEYVYNTTVTNNWISYPNTNITGFDVSGYFFNIPKENFYGTLIGNTGHEVDYNTTMKSLAIKEDVNITTAPGRLIRKHNRVNFKGRFAFNDTIPSVDTKIFTLPEGYRPYINITSFCATGTNINNLSKVCVMYINTNGDVIIKNSSEDNSMSQGVIDVTFDVWEKVLE